MKTLAIIPARRGSKRIPLKNIKLFYGRPMLSYPIVTAIQSKLFDEVMVSTEDIEIADIAKRAGAQVPFLRNPGTAMDSSSTHEVLQEVLGHYKEQNKIFDIICCIYPATPLLTVELLEKGLNLLHTEQFLITFPVVKYAHGIQHALTITENALAQPYFPQDLPYRTQDLRCAFHDAGQFYWYFAKHMHLKESQLMETAGVFEVSPMQTQDIDTLDDWLLAEMKYERKGMYAS